VFLILCDTTIIYSAAGMGFFFDPHQAYLPHDPYYFNWTHFVFNHAIAIGLVAVYVVFGLLLYWRKRMGSGAPQPKSVKTSSREFSVSKRAPWLLPRQ